MFPRNAVAIVGDTMSKKATAPVLRKRALRLIHEFGVSQQFLAGKMHMTPSTFSRWLNDESAHEPRTSALDGLNEYMEQILGFVEKESQRSDPGVHTAATSDTAGRLQRRKAANK